MIVDLTRPCEPDLWAMPPAYRDAAAAIRRRIQRLHATGASWSKLRGNRLKFPQPLRKLDHDVDEMVLRSFAAGIGRHIAYIEADRVERAARGHLSAGEQAWEDFEALSAAYHAWSRTASPARPFTPEMSVLLHTAIVSDEQDRREAGR